MNVGKIVGKRKERLNKEDTENTKRRVKRGKFLAFDRKSPPIANYAKGGAPSSSGWVTQLGIEEHCHFGFAQDRLKPVLREGGSDEVVAAGEGADGVCGDLD
jgi:hypothetical protein